MLHTLEGRELADESNTLPPVLLPKMSDDWKQILALVLMFAGVMLAAVLGR